MDKRIVYSGIVLILLSLVAAFFYSSYLFQIPTFSNIGIVLAPNMTSSTAFQVNQSSLITLTYNSTEPIDAYIINSPAYVDAIAIIKNSYKLRQMVLMLEGNGTLGVYLNSTFGIFSNGLYASNSTINIGKPAYSASPNDYANGTYYLILQNFGNKEANVTVIETVNNNIYQKVGSIVYDSTLVGILFISGIGIIAFGVIRKSKAKVPIGKDDEAMSNNRQEEIEVRKENKKKRKQKAGRKGKGR